MARYKRGTKYSDQPAVNLICKTVHIYHFQILLDTY